MPRASFHFKPNGASAWTSETLDFERIPAIGELVAPAGAPAEARELHRVFQVVHCPGHDPHGVELFAEAVPAADVAVERENRVRLAH